MDPSSSVQELSAIVCCAVPTCRAPLTLTDRPEVACSRCGEVYRRLQHTFDFTPACWRQELRRWRTWEHLQQNGVVSYQADPAHNLSHGPRAD
jgi:predicted amidophosphoribosyltransferase